MVLWSRLVNVCIVRVFRGPGVQGYLHEVGKRQYRLLNGAIASAIQTKFSDRNYLSKTPVTNSCVKRPKKVETDTQKNILMEGNGECRYCDFCCCFSNASGLIWFQILLCKTEFVLTKREEIVTDQLTLKRRIKDGSSSGALPLKVKKTPKKEF